MHFEVGQFRTQKLENTKIKAPKSVFMKRDIINLFKDKKNSILYIVLVRLIRFYILFQSGWVHWNRIFCIYNPVIKLNFMTFQELTRASK